MTKDEALRLALEALEDLGNHDRICPQWPTYAEPENYPKCNCGYDQAITAIKAALEAKDEPVAEIHSSTLRWIALEDHRPSNALLYTTPPQRTWVGLTDAELAEFSDMKLGSYDLCLEVEAKLKEKNA